jgi:hypothetical protein
MDEKKPALTFCADINPFPMRSIPANNLKLLFFAAFITLTLALASCGGEPVVTYYAVGYLFEKFITSACYYENGTRYILYNDIDSPHASADAITVSRGKIYAAGCFKRNNSPVYRACYWDKDGNRIDLHPDGAAYSSVTAIAVSGKNVYTAGEYVEGEYISNGVWKRCYWKNGGNPVTLTTAQDVEFFSVNNIAVSGDSVYITGVYHCYDDEYGIVKACYYKDGNFTDMHPVNASGSFAYGVTVSGNSVYIAGSYIEDNIRKACYWTKTETAQNCIQTTHLHLTPFQSLYQAAKYTPQALMKITA